MRKTYQGLFQYWEVAIATKLIHEYQGQWTCLQNEDLEDLLQECLIPWFYVREGYDPERGASKKTFMAKVIRNRLKDLVKEREYDKRKLTSITISLDAPLTEDEDSPSLVDTIETAAQPDPMSSIHLKIDLKRIIKKLPEKQKVICRLLGEMGLTVQELSEQLNIPRGTLYDEIKRIREVFGKQGIKNYLKKDPTDSKKISYVRNREKDSKTE